MLCKAVRTLSCLRFLPLIVLGQPLLQLAQLNRHPCEARRKSRTKAGDLDQNAKPSMKNIVSLLPTGIGCGKYKDGGECAERTITVEKCSTYLYLKANMAASHHDS
jgi:hypothetical protein